MSGNSQAREQEEQKELPSRGGQKSALEEIKDLCEKELKKNSEVFRDVLSYLRAIVRSVEAMHQVQGEQGQGETGGGFVQFVLFDLLFRFG